MAAEACVVGDRGGVHHLPGLHDVLLRGTQVAVTSTDIDDRRAFLGDAGAADGDGGSEYGADDERFHVHGDLLPWVSKAATCGLRACVQEKRRYGDRTYVLRNSLVAGHRRQGRRSRERVR